MNSNSMVTNPKTCDEEDALKIYKNGGALEYTQSGGFVHLPIKTYYNPKSIANVLSLKAISEMKGYKISMNTNEDSSIMLHHGDLILKSPHSANELYYCTEYDISFSALESKIMT